MDEHAALWHCTRTHHAAATATSPAAALHLASGSGGSGWNSRVRRSRRNAAAVAKEQAGPTCRRQRGSGGRGDGGGEKGRWVDDCLDAAPVESCITRRGAPRCQVASHSCAAAGPLACPPARYRCLSSSRACPLCVSASPAGTAAAALSTQASEFMSRRQTLCSARSRSHRWGHVSKGGCVSHLGSTSQPMSTGGLHAHSWTACAVEGCTSPPCCRPSPSITAPSPATQSRFARCIHPRCIIEFNTTGTCEL